MNWPKIDWKKEFSMYNIILLIIILVSGIVFLNIYNDYQRSENTNILVEQKFQSNEFFDAEIKIKNINFKKHAIVNDFLIYSISIEPKREDILNFSIEVSVRYGDKSDEKIYDLKSSFKELGTTLAYQTPIHLENSGQNIIISKISLIDIPEEKIHRDESGEMIGISGQTDWELTNLIDVKTELEVLQMENLKNQQFGMIITGIIGTITAFALIANLKISHRQSNFLKEQNEISKGHVEYLGVLEVMKSFNNDENGRRRDELYSKFQNNNLYDANDYIFDKETRNDVASIRGNYDMIGSLVKNGFVQKEKVLDMYAESIIMMYKVLRPHINYERTQRKSKKFAENFKWIFDEAKKYWKENYPDVDEPGWKP